MKKKSITPPSLIQQNHEKNKVFQSKGGGKNWNVDHHFRQQQQKERADEKR